jgi:hypothetical protein
MLVLLVCAGLVLCLRSARGQSLEERCTANAHALVNAATQYALDHDEHLPPTRSERAFEMALLPYVKDRSVFLCPATHLLYRLNPAVSNQTLAAIADFGTAKLLRDARPHPDGEITIAYLDGYVTHGGVDLTPEADCARFARKLVDAVEMYAQDYNGFLPSLPNSVIAQQLLAPTPGTAASFNVPTPTFPMP